MNFYAASRLRLGNVTALRDQETPPPERLLQLIWYHQRILRDQLVVADGRRLQVLHPGFWNRSAGPDFTGAVLQWGGERPVSGDIEIDLVASGWHGHGHDTNPNYKNVLLHVVWDQPRADGLPSLALKPVLDAPLGKLAAWFGTDAAKSFPDAITGQCCAPLQGLNVEQMAELLQQAALVRLSGKAALLQSRARQTGWEQAFWEGMFRALGYRNNTWPMQRLAELLPKLMPKQKLRTPLVLQSRLFGAAGVLPTEPMRENSGMDAYLLQLWEVWWREQALFTDCILPRSVWRLNGMRPANHPQRRLALAAHWLSAPDFLPRLEKWCPASFTGAGAAEALFAILGEAKDEYWSRHWTMRGKSFSPPQPLIGQARVTDLAMNVILPWLWLRAREGGNTALQQKMEQRYLAWPAGEDNAVLRLARQRLLKGAKLPPTAAAQQGLLQIIRDFCEHSDARCTECQFPALVREWQEMEKG